MKSRKQMRFSPYIYKTRGTAIGNRLTRKRVKLPSRIIACLNKLKKSFSLADAENVFKASPAATRALINGLLKEQFLYFADDKKIFKKYTYKLVEIEICTNCTFRCIYCPVSISQPPKQVMSNELFELILKKIKVLRPFRVCLNHYNEPLLDPGFMDKVAILKKHNIQLILYTNALLLSKAIIEDLARLGNTAGIAINFPSLSYPVYTKMVGLKIKQDKFREVIENIKFAVKKGLDVIILVNGSRKTAENNYAAIKKYFDKITPRPKVVVNLSHDRAGSIASAETKKTRHINGFLGGCDRSITSLSIDVNGKIFLCTQDYFKKNIFGDLKRQKLEDIIFGKKMIDFKKKIFGDMRPGKEFICRECVEMRKKCAGNIS